MLIEFERTIAGVLESDAPMVEQAVRLSDAINDLLAERPGGFTAAVMDADIFTHASVAWRRDQFRRLLLPGVLVDASLLEGDDGA